MTQYRQSGMGDCPVQERVKVSNEKFSSKFFGFCHDMPLVGYGYQLLMINQQGLIESVQSELPEDAKGSSEAQEPVRPRAQAFKRARDVSALAKSLERPIWLAKSEHEKREDYESARLTKAKRLCEEREIAKELESDLKSALEEINSYHGKAPQYLLKKKAHLEKQLESIYDTAPSPIFKCDSEKDQGSDGKYTSKSQARAKSVHQSMCISDDEDKDEDEEGKGGEEDHSPAEVEDGDEEEDGEEEDEDDEQWHAE